MSAEERFKSTLHEINEIYLFLMNGEPSPDDEIEARPKLINLFNILMSLDAHHEYDGLIEGILDKLEKWDTLELWFSETSIPQDIKSLLKIPDDQAIRDKKSIPPLLKTDSPQKIEKTEIDITQIVDKVSEQFKGEIDGLRGTIEGLKKELEKKDETLKSITGKKKVQKIIPKKETKLPPLKIKIPILKKPIQEPKVTHYVKKVDPIPKEIPQIKAPKTEKVNEEKNLVKNNLSPIPIKPEIKGSAVNKEELTSIPTKKPEITPYVFEEPKERPLVTEKRKISTVITNKTKNTPEVELNKEDQNVLPFSMEKPKIASVRIEEIETESIKSSANDLFNVFSSVGEKTVEKKPQKAELEEENLEIGKKKKEEKKDVKTEIVEPSQSSPFVVFGKPKSRFGDDIDTSNFDELPSDKDSLYQELIALEGKRYSLEKSFKELEKSYSRGSIADTEFKNQNEIIKKKLSDITSRINNIRRLISSM